MNCVNTTEFRIVVEEKRDRKKRATSSRLKTNIKAPIISYANIEIQSEPMLGNQLVSVKLQNV